MKRAALGAGALAVGVAFGSGGASPEEAGCNVGTVEEQRARLPPPAECTDPVEGVWLSLRYSAGYREWYEDTLNIRRTAAGSSELMGEITAHYWYGTPTDANPPSCQPGGFEAVVRMARSRGLTQEDGTILFGASQVEVDHVPCGAWGGHRYNPDNFTGKIDPERQEFQSVNNDGGRAVNEPTVFRRVRCFDAPRRRPGANVVPPALAPVKRGVSCGR